jgi:RNA polymerase sigma factor (sigma-70 family)
VNPTSWIDDPSCRRRYAVPRTSELDDLLIAVGATKDRRAFTAVCDHFRPRVQTQMARLGLTPAAAEDVAQDVMETIWRKAHLYDPRKSGATTWVLQIARNRSIDLKRRSREVSLAAEDFYGIPDPAERSDDCLDTAQREQRVRAALDALPREQFTLVRLAFFEELSHSTIARRLNLPLGTVKSRLRLAFACLRRVLLEAGVTPGCALGMN